MEKRKKKWKMWANANEKARKKEMSGGDIDNFGLKVFPKKIRHKSSHSTLDFSDISSVKSLRDDLVLVR